MASKREVVKTVRFGKGFLVHEVKKGGLTYCFIDVASWPGRVQKNAVYAINCFQCLKRAERLKPKRGMCLTATAPGLKVHRITGADPKKQKTICNLNFAGVRGAIKKRPHASVNCGHCMRFSWR